MIRDSEVTVKTTSYLCNQHNQYYMDLKNGVGLKPHERSETSFYLFHSLSRLESAFPEPESRKKVADQNIKALP